MADVVEVIGEVTKVQSFTNNGGGIMVTVKVPHNEDRLMPGTIIANVQRIADVTFSFRDTYAEDDDEDQPEMFDD